MSIRTSLRAILLGMTIWALAVLPAWAGMHLALASVEPERILLTRPIETDAIFHLEFINSIYLARVRESFKVSPEGGISLILVESPSHGVFEYYDLIPQATGQARLNRPIGEIRLKSHDYEHHLLIMGNEYIHLKDFATNGKPLIIRILTEKHCQP